MSVEIGQHYDAGNGVEVVVVGLDVWRGKPQVVIRNIGNGAEGMVPFDALTPENEWTLLETSGARR